MRVTTIIFSLFLCVQIIYGQKPINVHQTARDTTDRLSPKPQIHFGPDFTSADVLKVDNSVKFQTILGFGGAITEAAAYTYSLMNAENKRRILNAYYGIDGLAYTIGRVHMNSCDFSIKSYSEDDVAGDYELTKFNISHDEIWLIPMIKDIQATSRLPINLFLTPWSPPAWMKQNGAMDGSTKPGLIQTPEVFKSWALFFSKFISAYQKHEINFWGLTVQNEPEYAAPWEACAYNPEQERDFIKNYLGPQLKKDHPDVKIMIFDHNKDDITTWAKTIYGDPEAAQYVWGTAFHWYTGSYFENLVATHEVDPSKHLLATEASVCEGVDFGNWTVGETYGVDIIGDLNNWAEGWVDWNIVLDSIGGPNHLKNYCAAPIIANPATQQLRFLSIYYYLGHFSRFIPRGARRIQHSCPSTLLCTAFAAPANVNVVVVQNIHDKATNFKLLDGTNAANVTVPAHGIITLSYVEF